MSVSVPVFRDQKTPTPFVENFPEDDGEGARAALPDHIYMDAMGFGMGNCCLQVHTETRTRADTHTSSHTSTVILDMLDGCARNLHW